MIPSPRIFVFGGISLESNSRAERTVKGVGDDADDTEVVPPMSGA
jgi:hypothetical protein